MVGDKDVVRGGTDIEALIKKFMGIFFRIGAAAASAASPESRRGESCCGGKQRKGIDSEQHGHRTCLVLLHCPYVSSLLG